MININYHNFQEINNQTIYQQVASAITQLKHAINQNLLPAINIVQQNHEINLVKSITNGLNLGNYTQILILGTGGSSLGGKTFSALNLTNKLIFLESIDPTTVQRCFDSLNLAQTLVLIISKSGETTETICQTLLLIEKFKQSNLVNWKDQFLFITENQNNTLINIAKSIQNNSKAKIFAHNPNIGGRYSCFSLVGLLPASLANIDISAIVLGAREALNDLLYNNNDDLQYYCTQQLIYYQQHYCQNVLMPYVDQLYYFNNWFRQLFAESIGKNGFGITPINSTGTIDQHSQLQLYLDGKKDKMFTFILNTEFNNHNLDLPKSNTIFSNKTLHQILQIEALSTIQLLSKKQVLIRVINLPCLNEHYLAKLMMNSFFETIVLAYSQNIDPFNQPAVEMRKQIAKQMLCQ
jgi:glucose-6-phosphate isomerase